MSSCAQIRALAGHRVDIAALRIPPAKTCVNPLSDKQSKTLTDPPSDEGFRVERVASFLGKRIDYQNEVVEYLPDCRLRLRSSKGQIPMVVTYEFEDADKGTLTRGRVEGEDGGRCKLAGPAPGAP